MSTSVMNMASSMASSMASHMASASSTHAMSMATSSAAATATKAASSMGGMSMGGSSSPNACKISMLWNWNTINSCFIARSWHIRTRAHFAGSCIGIVALAVLVEIVRRFQREYDRYLLRTWQQCHCPPFIQSPADSNGEKLSYHTTHVQNVNPPNLAIQHPFFPALGNDPTAIYYTPTLFQQAIRATFYLLQYAGAYFIMLLAMYYNGYIIICIFIGCFLGYFLFGADSFKPASPNTPYMQPEIQTHKTCCC